MDHPPSSQTNILDDNPPLFPAESDQSKEATRLPLSNRANIHVNTATNWEHKDSSEGQPSTHDSICDAAWVSTSDFAKSPYQTPGRPATPLRSGDIDLGSESPLSRLETPFLYGFGTELAPILEQRSIATLRTKGSMSTSDLSSLLHDAPGGENSHRSRCKSDETAVHVPQHSHRYVKREDILPTAYVQEQAGQPSPQLKCLTYSRPTVHVVDMNTYPRKPVYPPPQPTTTPPNLMRINHPQGEGDTYIDSNSPNGFAYEAPDFRSPRSGYGNLNVHPFMRQANAGDAHRLSTLRGPSRSMRSRESGPPTPYPDARYTGPSTRYTDFGSPDDDYLTRWNTFDWPCSKCHRPRNEFWSLGSTIIGYGPGIRRGNDWCSRCACRKLVRIWCCIE